MENEKKRFSIGKKIYLFVGVTVFLAAMAVAFISHLMNSNRIDEYFRRLSRDTARNFATYVDPEYLMELRETAESEEFQALREKAEEEDDEEAIEKYLRDKGLWDGYEATREKLDRYLRNMEDVKYLYIVVWGGKNEIYDMYLIDDYDNPLYSTGYYEEREMELRGIDASKEVEPTISKGDWGWLCSSYTPVYSPEGILVCQVGCDVGMDDILHERRMNLLYNLFAAICITAVILAGVMYLMRRIIIKPLNQITSEMKKFSPSGNLDYEESGVIDLDIKSRDEIEDIYNEIRSMQVRIIDYLNDINAIEKEKEKAERDVKKKNREIGKISKEAYLDPLTRVGNKAAYVRKTEEMNQNIGQDGEKFAIVMVDVNRLKVINDEFGHAAGDEYLKGCSGIVCRIYKHSPVYRIGGDEFVVILTGEDFHYRYDKLDQMRAAFETSYDKSDVDPWERYSAASGMSEYAEGDDNVEAVFERADKAMYEDKARYKKENGIDTDVR